MSKAVAVLRGESTCTGTVTFTQAKESDKTTVTIDLKGLAVKNRIAINYLILESR